MHAEKLARKIAKDVSMFLKFCHPKVVTKLLRDEPPRQNKCPSVPQHVGERLSWSRGGSDTKLDNIQTTMMFIRKVIIKNIIQHLHFGCTKIEEALRDYKHSLHKIKSK